MLADEAGPASRAVELTIVTSALSPRLVERLAHRAMAHHGASLVYVDASTFAAGAPTGGTVSRPRRPRSSCASSAPAFPSSCYAAATTSPRAWARPR